MERGRCYCAINVVIWELKYDDMKKILLAAVVLFGLGATSCVTTNRGLQSSPVISRNVQLDPIKADIRVDESEKLVGKSTAAYVLMFRVGGDNTYADGINYSTDASAGITQMLNPLKLAQSTRLNKVRGAAAYQALRSGEFDVLVHPSYTTTVKNYWFYKKYSVEVTGYGAKYENFRTERQKIVILEDGSEYILQDNQ